MGDFNTVLSKTDRLSNNIDSSTKDFADLCKQLKVEDTSSHRNKQDPQYTWEHPGNCNLKSRIDYILVFYMMLKDIKAYKIINALISDHKAVLITIDTTCLTRGPGYWKLNTSLLEDTGYISGVRNIIRDTIQEYNAIEDKRSVWDMVKILIREYSIGYGLHKS